MRRSLTLFGPRRATDSPTQPPCGRDSEHSSGRSTSRREALALLAATCGVGLLALLTGRQAPEVDSEPEGLPLYARAEFGLASTVSAEPGVVSSGLHAAERRLGTTFAVANSYINFDTNWSGKQPGWDIFGAEGRTLVLAWAPVRHGRSVLLSDVAAGRYVDHVD